MKKKKTKQILKVVFVFISIGSLYFVPWIVIWAWILPLPHTVQDQLNEAVVHGSDGIIVYIDQGGKPPSLYAAGWHDRKNRVPVNPQALFKIANITKLYITVATAKLVHANRLSLDKTLADYIPSLLGKIKNADKITLRMLVKHRSGIPNITDTPNFWKNLPHNNSAAFKLITALPTHFEPDEAYEYSNSNYLLISIIIDKILGYNHQQFIKEEILIPHRLNNTFGSISEVNSNEVMSGYFTGFESDINTNDFGWSMIATASDVGKFLRLLNDGSLFNTEEQEIYDTIYDNEHSGLLPGYQSIAAYHKDIDTVIIQFINTSDLDSYNWDLSEIIYNRILKIVRNQKVP